jgi:hypothetical protein
MVIITAGLMWINVHHIQHAATMMERYQILVHALVAGVTALLLNNFVSAK